MWVVVYTEFKSEKAARIEKNSKDRICKIELPPFVGHKKLPHTRLRPTVPSPRTPNKKHSFVESKLGSAVVSQSWDLAQGSTCAVAGKSLWIRSR